MQKLRRIVGAACKDHFLGRAYLHGHAIFAALHIAHADRALAFEDDVGGMRMRAHINVRPLPRRVQERSRSTDAQPVLDRALGVGDALLDRAVVIKVARNAERDRARHEGFAERILPVHGGDGESAVAAAIGVIAFADPALQPLEIRQHVRIAPTAIAELRPGIEILALAAIIDVAVDRGGAAERLAARRIDAASARVGAGLLLVRPVDALHVEGLDEARRQMDVGVPIARTCFEHADGGNPILAKPVRQHASGRARAHNHIIERFHRTFSKRALCFGAFSSREPVSTPGSSPRACFA